MKKRAINMLLAGILVGVLAACSEDSSVLGPDSGNQQSTEVDLSVDPDLTEAIVTDAEAALNALVSPAPAPGAPSLFGAPPDTTKIAEARALLAQAREKFAAARQAWAAGDTETAAQLALEGRTLVAEAMTLVFGEEAVQRFMERVEHVISWLRERVDEESSTLLARIRELKDEAQVRWDGGDFIGALERLILALQIAERERAHMRRTDIGEHARLSVFMANSSIGLATEVVGTDATDRQLLVLRHAEFVLSEAERALGVGRFRLAFSLARETVNLALVAVMLEPTTDVEKVQAMINLSERAIMAAETAVSQLDPTSFPVRLLEHAKTLQARGIEISTTEPRVAIHVLWYASTLAYGVIQLAG